jgi:hypothetical protein
VVHTTAKAHIDKGEGGFKITTIEPRTEAKVPGIDDKTLRETAEAARKDVPFLRPWQART